MNAENRSDPGRIAVVIPMYRTGLSDQELLSLRQAFKVLGRYRIVAAVPESLDMSPVLEMFPALEAERFEDCWFNGIKSYNRLVLSSFFYERFSSYEYMLIYQLDAYVFEDRLEEWAAKGYDYIGAPWIPRKKIWFTWIGKLKMAFNRIFCHNSARSGHFTFLFEVGNGGFSLRRIPTFIELTRHYAEKISHDLRDEGKLCPEDLWLHFEPSGKYRLRKPEWQEALGFSFEQNPWKSFELNGQKLPFGCHAWYHPDYRDFWKGIIG